MQPFAPPAEDPQLRTACRVESLGRPVAFSEAARAELEALFSRYPNRQAALLPALWLASREFGWISREAITLVADLCRVPPSHVYGVVSFYTMYNREPKGKILLRLCTNLSCQARGAEHLLECLREKLGIGPGETTQDGLFSLEEVECLAACEMAPVLQVNEDLVGPLTPAATRELLDRLREENGKA